MIEKIARILAKVNYKLMNILILLIISIKYTLRNPKISFHNML